MSPDSPSDVAAFGISLDADAVRAEVEDIRGISRCPDRLCALPDNVINRVINETAWHSPEGDAFYDAYDALRTEVINRLDQQLDSER